MIKLDAAAARGGPSTTACAWWCCAALATISERRRSRPGGPPSNRAPRARAETLRRYWPWFCTIRTMSKPVVAMVDGYAVGGAFALVCASDLVCASERALFVPAFCQIGIVPEMGMMKLPRPGGAAARQRAAVLRRQDPRAPAVRLGRGEPRVPDGNARKPTRCGSRASWRGCRRVHPSHEEHHERALADGNAGSDAWKPESTASPFCTTTKAYAATMEKFAR